MLVIRSECEGSLTLVGQGAPLGTGMNQRFFALRKNTSIKRSSGGNLGDFRKRGLI